MIHLSVIDEEISTDLEKVYCMRKSQGCVLVFTGRVKSIFLMLRLIYVF